jgi:hypothetical protein
MKKIAANRKMILGVLLPILVLSIYVIPQAEAYTLRAVGAKDVNNQGHKKTGIGATILITLPQDLKTSSDSQSVSYHVSSGIDSALNNGAQGGMVEVGYVVYQTSQSQASWFAEYFENDFDCCPDHYEGAPGSAGSNGQWKFYKAESDPNYWWVWRFYQGSTVLVTISNASGGLTYTTGTMPLRAWMELQSNNENPVVGTSFATAMFYLPQTRSLGYQAVTYGTAIYERGDECLPYKSQGEEQNPSLGAQQIKLGNNQGITTACVSSGAYLFKP